MAHLGTLKFETTFWETDQNLNPINEEIENLTVSNSISFKLKHDIDFRESLKLADDSLDEYFVS